MNHQLLIRIDNENHRVRGNIVVTRGPDNRQLYLSVLTHRRIIHPLYKYVSEKSNWIVASSRLVVFLNRSAAKYKKWTYLPGKPGYLRLLNKHWKRPDKSIGF